MYRRHSDEVGAASRLERQARSGKEESGLDVGECDQVGFPIFNAIYQQDSKFGT